MLTLSCLAIVASIIIPAAAKTRSSWTGSSPSLAFSNHHHTAIRRSVPHPSKRGSSSTSSSIMQMQHHPTNQSSSTMTLPPTTNTKRIVLIGGGHAHVQVIKALNVNSRPSNLHVTLVDLQSSASYSGMVPGCVSKLYTLDQVQINLDSLADWAGMDFVRGKVVGMSFEEETNNENDDHGTKKKKEKKLILVETKTNDGNDDDHDGNNVGSKLEKIPFDVVSIDIGSTSRDFSSIPGASRYTISTRPISDLVRRIEKEEEELKGKLEIDGTTTSGAQVVVVGGGAAGIELSLALRSRWNNLLDSKLSIKLIDSNNVLFPSEASACRSALQRVMEKYSIEVLHNLVVDEVTSSHVHVSSNNNNAAVVNADSDDTMTEKIPYTHCIWATGAEAHTLAWDMHEQFGLAISPDRGWIRVNRHLQSVSHPSVFAAGDCCEIVNGDRKSPSKAGVYAVRSGPILIENLTRFLGVGSHCIMMDDAADERDLVAYNPQDDFLKLLMCGDGTALGFRFGIPLYGTWVWELKDHIDQMFMNLFDVKNLPTHDSETIENEVSNEEEGDDEDFDTAQYDQYEAKKERMKAEDACELLLRTDDDVDFQRAWNVLREMMGDKKYKEDVLSIFHRSPLHKR